MKLEAILIQTEAWAQEELAAQERVIGLLEKQAEAVITSNTEALLASTEALEKEIASRPARERRRRKLMQAFGVHFGVAPETLTLSSISERARTAGIVTERLDTARQRVREAASRALRAGRKLAVLARYHQGFFQEVLQTLTASGAPDGTEGNGSWVHVEA